MTVNQSRWAKFFNNTFVKIVLSIIVCVAVLVASQAGMSFILKKTPLSEEMREFIGTAVSAILVLLVYRKLFQVYDKRAIHELDTRHLLRDMALGILIGAVLQTLTIGVIYLYHGYTIISVNSFVKVLPALGISLGAAIGEELVFRGIIFRITQEKLGNYAALAISALLFGFAHFFNPGATLLSSLSIAVEAGLLLGAAYILTNNLWLPIAIHFAWDFMESGIYGATMSGNVVGKSLITSSIQGPHAITGGVFGPEVSVQGTLFCLIAAVIMLAISKRRGVMKAQ